jgi:hypothetical protein
MHEQRNGERVALIRKNRRKSGIPLDFLTIFRFFETVPEAAAP